jgi:hypothetical protein
MTKSHATRISDLEALTIDQGQMIVAQAKVIDALGASIIEHGSAIAGAVSQDDFNTLAGRVESVDGRLSDLQAEVGTDAPVAVSVETAATAGSEDTAQNGAAPAEATTFTTQHD